MSSDRSRARCRRARASAASIAGVLILSVAPSSAGATARDLDRDGLSNRYEVKQSHTKPRRSDTDGDKLRDGFEVRRSRTDPRLKDTDGDGLTDGSELRRLGTSPRRKDTDRDGTSDGLELLSGTDPLTRGKKKGQLLPDSTPPETTITSGPSGIVPTSEAIFEFSSSEAWASFECRLDSAAWAKCSSPRTYSGLTNSSHTFDVRAIDAASNSDTSPATRTWMVAVTSSPEPPTASFTWSPQNPQNPPVPVAFTSTSACAATPCTYEWRHGSPSSEPIGTGQTSTWTYESTGTKTVVLRVTDALGRFAEATNSFTVSSAPPPPAVCADAADNDGDGKTDYPADPGCTDAGDDSESPDPVPPPPPTSTVYGFHQGLGYFGDNTYWAPRLDAVTRIGSKVTRGTLLWDIVEPSDDAFTWTRYDALVDAVEARGMVHVVDLGRSPNWANGSTDRWVVPTDQAAFDRWVREYAEFAGRVAARYAGRGLLYEIWNEPNEHYFWRPTPSVDRYAQLFTAARNAILQADPQAKVGLGGITGLGASCCLQGIRFISDLVDRAVQFDYAGIHPYVSQLDRGPDTHVAGEQNFDDVKAVHDMLVSKGRLGVKLWLTEWGWPACSPAEATRAAWLKQGHEIIRDQWSSFVTISAYFFDVDTPDYPCAGAFRKDFSRKPLADAFDQFAP